MRAMSKEIEKVGNVENNVPDIRNFIQLLVSAYNL